MQLKTDAAPPKPRARNPSESSTKLRTSSEPVRLAVLDDIFPLAASAFRFEEFRTYLEEIPGSAVYSTGGALPLADETRPVTDLIRAHEATYPAHAGRVMPLEAATFPRADLYYGVFLHVISAFLSAIERQGAPFAFTLYPGGGFALDSEASDAALARVCASPCFRHVVATQPITRDYLLRKRFCRDDQVSSIFGGVLTRAALPPPPRRTRFGFGKSTLDLCFVANRYSAQGADKGYDLFVHAAQRLAQTPLDARFHVVGRYDASILDLGAAASRFTFYGPRPTPFFPGFYAGMDAIVSPTRPFVLGPGRFDGFPTGCSVEAGLQEVAVLCTDPLRLNSEYRDGIDLVLVEPEVENIVATILSLAREPGRLAALGTAARRRMLEVYSHARQMQPRLDLLRSLLGGEAASRASVYFSRNVRLT